MLLLFKKLLGLKKNTDLEKFLTKAGYNKIKMRKIKTQHFICRAQINGIKAKLLIDTGASNSCVNQSQKKVFFLEKVGDNFEAAGAGEDKMTAAMSRSCQLQLGRHKVKPFAFILLDMQHINASLLSQGTRPIDGIFGADFLNKNKALIDYENQRLWIK